MKANNEPVIIADEQEREQFLRAVLIQSQIQETPIEESVLRDKLSALEPEKWSLELLRALKEFEFKAKWAHYNPEERPPQELPQPFITKMDGKYIIIMKNNDKEFLTYSLEKNRTAIIVTSSDCSAPPTCAAISARTAAIICSAFASGVPVRSSVSFRRPFV